MSVLFRHVIYPAYHWVKRDGINRAIKELEQNQWRTSSELISIQQRKLDELIAFAGKNVPYYRRIFRDLGMPAKSAASSEDWARVPSLTKSILRRERDDLVSEDLKGNRLRENSTSGSTGESLRFYTDFRSMAYRTAAGIRSDSFAGWKLGERHVSLWGAPIDQKQATRMRGRLHGWVTGHCFLSSFDLSSATMDAYIRKIRRFKPTTMEAYPGPMEQFAIHCSNRGVRFPFLRAVISSAETLWPHQRETIENCLGVRVFDRYGCREVGQIGSECSVHAGVHISVDRLKVEVVDDEGQLCPPGEEGSILITDLDNYGMPLIRYEIGDVGAWKEQSDCSCGRGLPLFNRLVGRTLDVVRTSDGRAVGGTFWTLLLKSRPGIAQLQVVQDRLDGIIIKFIRENDFEPAVLDYFARRIKEYCGTDFQVEFVECESIDLTKSGKRRLVISRVSDRGDSGTDGRLQRSTSE